MNSCLAFSVILRIATVSAAAAGTDISSTDKDIRRSAVDAEIGRRKRIIQEAVANLDGELGKEEPDRDEVFIRDMLDLMRELRAVEALDFLCQNIDYEERRFKLRVHSLTPLRMRHPVAHAVQSIGSPSKDVLLAHLVEAQGRLKRWLLFWCLVRVVGPETARVELERSGLGDLKIRLHEVYPYLRPSKPGPANDNGGDEDR